MKKILFTIALLLSTVALRADLVLCWELPSDSTEALGWYRQPTTIGTAVDKAGNSLGSVSYGKLGYFTSSQGNQDAYSSDAMFRDNTQYASDYTWGSGESAAITTLAADDALGEAYSVITAGNYYYIALFNEYDQLVAYSHTFEASSVTGSTFTSGAWKVDVSAFSGSGYAVPEPTSGLLMLLGMAGLALRRKKTA
jgi:hypothetical protein